MRQLWLAFAEGKPYVITSARRTLARQRQLYNAYLRGGPLAAAPGNSAHNYGLAVDFVVRQSDGSTRAPNWLDHARARRYGLATLSGDQLRRDPWHVEVPNWRQYVTRPRRRRAR